MSAAPELEGSQWTREPERPRAERDAEPTADEPRRDDLRQLFGSGAAPPPLPTPLAERAREIAAKVGEAGAAAELFPGVRLGDLEVVRLLGSGGQADVYLARDRGQGRLQALKVPRRDVANRLLHEARIASRLDHPRIVRVERVVVDGPVPYLVLEYCPGRSLAEWIAVHHDDPVAPLAFVKKTAAAILEALAYAHAKGVVHRDVKPANILLDGEGKVKVCDFGIGCLALTPCEDRALAQSVAATGAEGGGTAFAGTPRYMAPEQENPALRPGGRIDGRADIYAFGKVLYELLTGCSPRTVKPASRVRASVPEAWDEFIFRCVEERPESRFGSAGEAAFALGRLPISLAEARRERPEPEPAVDHMHRTRPPIAGIPSLDTRQAVAKVREDGREPITPYRVEPPTRAEVDRARSEASGRLRALEEVTGWRLGYVLTPLARVLGRCAGWLVYLGHLASGSERARPLRLGQVVALLFVAAAALGLAAGGIEPDMTPFFVALGFAALVTYGLFAAFRSQPPEA